MMQSQFGPIIAEDVDFVLGQLGARLEVLGGTTLMVTGASGFLCSYFVDIVAALNDRGLHPTCRVLAVDTSCWIKRTSLRASRCLRRVNNPQRRCPDLRKLRGVFHGGVVAQANGDRLVLAPVFLLTWVAGEAWGCIASLERRRQ